MKSSALGGGKNEPFRGEPLLTGETSSYDRNPLKSMKTLWILIFLAAGLASGVAEQFRTDINPALRYYQAFILAPDLSPADHDYLLTNDWRGQKLPERFGELLARYNNQFTLVRQAAYATVPCDWGIDMSPGPATLLPGLARNKAIVVTARLRAMWFLQNGRPAEAAQDLVASFTLARNSSRDGTLISVLVQIACENILCAAVAENYFQLSPETLKQVVDGFDAAPSRGTVAASLSTERAFFHDWLKNKILELQKQNPGDESKVMASVHDLIIGMQGDEGGQNATTQEDFWRRLLTASGGTSSGILDLLRSEEPLYEKAAAVMALPQHEYENQMKEFQQEIQQSTDPFMPQMFSAWEKCRVKEFACLVRLAMVRAAAEYKLHGEQGLRNVLDPYSQAPFSFDRIIVDGIDRGFELTSAYAGRGNPETLVFVEKDGPSFSVTPKFENRAGAKSSTAK